MRMVFGLVLLVGIALAGGAVYLAKDRIAQYQNANAQAQAALARIVPTQTVYVAADTLSYGQKLTKEDVRAIDWPENAIPEGTFTDMSVLFPENTDELRVVLRTIEKDEPLMAVKITEPGEDTGLTSRLERGMRAFTICFGAQLSHDLVRVGALCQTSDEHWHLRSWGGSTIEGWRLGQQNDLRNHCWVKRCISQSLLHFGSAEHLLAHW